MQDLHDLLFIDFLSKPLWMWGLFLTLVFGLLAADLGIVNRKDHEIGIKESLILSAGYIGIGLAFGGWVWMELGRAKALEYWTGFVVEKTLAMDNIFVIAMIFSYMAVPRLYQHRVLFWGILGVVVLRGIMIGLGAAIVAQFHWVLYIFGAFLVGTGVKMLLSQGGGETQMQDNAVRRFMHRHFRVTEDLRGHAFFVREKDAHGHVRLFITPLFVTLAMIEIADVIFAVDSIPAVFAITLDPFIVYTSNIFAILGLRALFFALSAMIGRFEYLKYALSAILVFIGSKIFIVEWTDLEKFPPMLSLGLTVGMLGAGIVFSLLKTRGGGYTKD